MTDPAPHFRPGVPGLIPDAWIVGPAPKSEPKSAPGAGGGLRPDSRAIVAVHGVTRNIEEMVRHLAPRARAAGRTLVIPHFDRRSWRRYQRAACPERADWALLRLMAALWDEGRVGGGPFDLSGFSGGGQFAHRFTWLYPAMVGRLCVAAPGWWTFPDTGAAWPYGMAHDPDGAPHALHLQANLRRFLDRPIAVCVGADDVARDENLRQGPEIDARQGPHRLARARAWSAAMHAAARDAGLAPRIELTVMQGCGHAFADCATRGGLDRLFVPDILPDTAPEAAPLTVGEAARRTAPDDVPEARQASASSCKTACATPCAPTCARNCAKTCTISTERLSA